MNGQSDTHPVPSINGISDQLGKTEYFPTVDQVQLAEHVSAISEFGIPTGHFEFLRFSAGLKTSPDILVARFVLAVFFIRIWILWLL
jgi:hypothetical protein